MTLTIPTPAVMWSSNDPVADAFDMDAQTWYQWGVSQYAESQPLINERDARWVEANQYPSALYMGKQFPMWSVYYNVVNGLPVYQSLPYEFNLTGDVHKHRLGTPTQNVLPSQTIHYVNNPVSGASTNDTAWALFYAKQTSVLFELTIDEPLTAFSTYYGCVPWIYNNANAADGVIAVNDYLLANYTNPVIPAKSSNRGFGLNQLTEITYDGSSWDNDVVAMNVGIDRGCNYIHQGAGSWQEEVWPSRIDEGTKVTGMTMDLFYVQGREKSMVEDVFNSGGVGVLSVKLFDEAINDNYISFGTVGATSVFRQKAAINMPPARDGTTASMVARFSIPLPEIEIKDDFTSSYSTV